MHIKSFQSSSTVHYFRIRKPNRGLPHAVHNDSHRYRQVCGAVPDLHAAQFFFVGHAQPVPAAQRRGTACVTNHLVVSLTFHSNHSFPLNLTSSFCQACCAVPDLHAAQFHFVGHAQPVPAAQRRGRLA